MNCGRVHQPLGNSFDRVFLEYASGQKVMPEYSCLKICKSVFISGDITLERLSGKCSDRSERPHKISLCFSVQHPAVVNVIGKKFILGNIGFFVEHIIEPAHIFVELIATLVPCYTSSDQSKNYHKGKAVSKTVGEIVRKCIKKLKKEHDKNAFCLLW